MKTKVSLLLWLMLVVIFGMNLLGIFWFQTSNEELQVKSESIIVYEDNIDEILKEKNVLLFFSANWCPTCWALKKDIAKNPHEVPEDLAIIVIDYDAEIDLRKEYNVGIQHTLIYIDKDKKALKTFTWLTKIKSVIDKYYELIEEEKIQWNSREIYEKKIEKLKNISQEKEFLFSKYNLNTNTAKSSIPFNLILNWWPWKDGIPAINEPEFIEISEQDTQKWLKDDTMWISVKIWDKAKFYPYSILYWHEIVNDIVWDKKVSVTFCPLCGTAIVYNREINWEERLFWVSWKLYESNLLMYDDKNESLWSQSIGEAVVWDDLWVQLDILKSDIMTFSQFKSKYPSGKVLSESTGFLRSYTKTPYWSYETNDDLYFPVQNTDKRLEKKELLFVLPYMWDSYAFVRSELMKIGKLEYVIWSDKIQIIYDEWEITVKKWYNELPWYIEMWFSWVTQHPNSQNIWLWDK
jgi:thiol-disulfide isomerase/thioredoxin